jgi:hypothetical protein
MVDRDDVFGRGGGQVVAADRQFPRSGRSPDARLCTPMAYLGSTRTVRGGSRIERPEPVLHRLTDVVAGGHGQGKGEADVGQEERQEFPSSLAIVRTAQQVAVYQPQSLRCEEQKLFLGDGLTPRARPRQPDRCMLGYRRHGASRLMVATTMRCWMGQSDSRRGQVLPMPSRGLRSDPPRPSRDSMEAATRVPPANKRIAGCSGSANEGSRISPATMFSGGMTTRSGPRSRSGGAELSVHSHDNWEGGWHGARARAELSRLYAGKSAQRGAQAEAIRVFSTRSTQSRSARVRRTLTRSRERLVCTLQDKLLTPYLYGAPAPTPPSAAPSPSPSPRPARPPGPPGRTPSG